MKFVEGFFTYKVYLFSMLIGATALTPIAGADAELKFVDSILYGGDGDQRAITIAEAQGNLLVGGNDMNDNGKALLAKFSIPPVSLPSNNVRWTDKRKASTATASYFMDSAVTSEGVYFAGFSKLRTGKKKQATQSGAFLVKYALGNLSEPVWEKKPSFISGQNDEALYAVTSAVEGSLPAIYAVGQASTGKNNMTAILAKYSANGNLLWSQTLSDTSELKRGSATSVVVMDEFIYVGGFTSTDKEGAKFGKIPLVPALWKYDASGNQIWMKTLSRQLAAYSGAIDAYHAKVALTYFDSHLYLVATNQTRRGKNGDLSFVKYDVNGNKVWQSGWVPIKKGSGYQSQRSWATSIHAGKGRFYVAGYSQVTREKKGQKDDDAFLLEVDYDYGSVLGLHRFGKVDRSEGALDLASSGTNVYIIGHHRPSQKPKKNKKQKGPVKDADLMLLRYSIHSATTVEIDIDPTSFSNVVTLDEKQLAETKNKKIKSKEVKETQIAVAILSSSDFKASKDVEYKSLTFGRTGNEASWKGCSVKNIDQSSPIDLLCYFEKTWKPGTSKQFLFKNGDNEGILRGQLRSGERLIGKDKVKISAKADLPTSSLTDSTASTDAASSSASTDNSTVLSSTSSTSQASTPSTTTSSPTQSTETTAPSTTSSTTDPALSTTDDSPSTTSLTNSADAVTASTTSNTTNTEGATMDSTSTSIATTETTSSKATSDTKEADSTATFTPLVYPLPKETTITESTIATPTKTGEAVTKYYEEPTISNTEFINKTEPTTVLVSSSSGSTTSTFAPVTYKTATDSQIAARNEYLKKTLLSGSDGGGALVSRESRSFESKRKVDRTGDRDVQREEPLRSGDGLAHAYADLGKEALRKGQIDEAMTHFREALTMDPENVEIRNEIGVALFEQGRLQEAAAYFSEVLKLNPDDQIARSKLDTINARLGQVSQ